MSGMIKAVRQRRGMSQTELAKRAKLTQPYVAQLESGTKKNPSLDTLRRLAKALGVTVADIGAEKPAAPSTGIQLGTLRELLLGLAEKKRSEFMKAAEKVGIDREVAAVVWKGATLMKKVR